MSEWEELALGVLVAAWLWRLELAPLVAAVVGERLVARTVGEPAAGVLVLLAAAVAAGVAPSRWVCWRVLRRQWLRRSWERAVTDVGVADAPLRAPRVLGVTRVPAGDVLRVRVRRGQSVPGVDARREELAACLRVRGVRSSVIGPMPRSLG